MDLGRSRIHIQATLRALVGHWGSRTKSRSVSQTKGVIVHCVSHIVTCPRRRWRYYDPTAKSDAHCGSRIVTFPRHRWCCYDPIAFAFARPPSALPAQEPRLGSLIVTFPRLSFGLASPTCSLAAVLGLWASRDNSGHGTSSNKRLWGMVFGGHSGDPKT